MKSKSIWIAFFLSFTLAMSSLAHDTGTDHTHSPLEQYIENIDTDFSQLEQQTNEQISNRVDQINDSISNMQPDAFNQVQSNTVNNQNLVNSGTANQAVDKASNYQPGQNSLLDSTIGVQNTQTSQINSSYNNQQQQHQTQQQLNPTTISNSGGSTNTLEIVEQTMSAALSCMNWEIRGICVWMTCSILPPACTFDYSIKVKNYAPELTVQSYDKATREPWTESRYVNEMLLADADSSWIKELIEVAMDVDLGGVDIRGGVSTPSKKDKKAGLHYKLVDAYGNPAISMFNSLASSFSGLMCKGQATMFMPYFISNLDAISWRWNIPETFYPQSFDVFTTTYDLGSLANNYGPIYPRHGFITSQDPLKAAVLSAFRAVHFITRSGEPHIYQKLPDNSRRGYWPAGPLNKNNSDTGIWQMLYPSRETSCVTFPYGTNPSNSRRSTDNSYIWNFWKSYKCCQRRGSTLVYHNG